MKASIFTSLLVICAGVTSQQTTETTNQTDGIWTGHDWQDATTGYTVIDGDVYGLDDQTTKRLEQAQAVQGQVLDYLTKPNVQRIMQIFPESSWNSQFPDRLDVYTYQNFLRATAKFPYFCNDTAPNSSLTVD